MSILIKGMEMPTSCGDCRFCNGQADTDYGVCAWCDVDGNARDAYTMQDCPLVPVPPHGDLIDRDRFRESVFIGEQCLYSWDELEDAIDYAPAIIPASEEGENAD